MNLDSRTILITGGSAGIGFELATLLAPRNTIIITGRNVDRLRAAKEKLPTIHTIASDASDLRAIEALVTEVTTKFPALDMVINNAGIMRVLNLRAANDPSNIVQEIQTNLIGPMQLVQKILPHLESRPEAAIVNVTSGLAFVPMAASPMYSATKAGLHAYTQALRVQLKGTKVKVFELAPPATGTDLATEFPEGIADASINMDVKKLAKAAVRGFEKNTLEIRPGLANALHTVHRFAPGFVFTSKRAEAAVRTIGPNGNRPRL